MAAGRGGALDQNIVVATARERKTSSNSFLKEDSRKEDPPGLRFAEPSPPWKGGELRVVFILGFPVSRVPVLTSQFQNKSKIKYLMPYEIFLL